MGDTVGFLSKEQVRAIRREFGTPVYVYDEAALVRQAQAALAFPNAYGLTVRFAMKALPTAAVLRTFHEAGLYIDASSGFEAERAMRAGVPPEHIQLTAQEIPPDFAELVRRGVLFNACSLSQLRQYGEQLPGSEVSIRVNPGKGSGHSNRTNVGGPAASFGIWHEKLDAVLALEREFDLRISRMHTHIGSGADPSVWRQCARMSLAIAGRLPDVTTLNLGGGFKVARVAGEEGTDLIEVGERIAEDVRAFHAEHGRRLHIEIEPGTLLVANVGAVVCSVIDVVDTGAGGYHFIKVDSGMTEVLRPSLYGAQHPLAVVPAEPAPRGERDYIVAGHCCESGDILTPEPGNPEALLPRTLTEARIGDAFVIGGAGAYCAAMASKNYNSFPEAAEVMIRHDGQIRLIRARQTLEQMTANEIL